MKRGSGKNNVFWCYISIRIKGCNDEDITLDLAQSMLARSCYCLSKNKKKRTKKEKNIRNFLFIIFFFQTHSDRQFLEFWLNAFSISVKLLFISFATHHILCLSYLILLILFYPLSARVGTCTQKQQFPHIANFPCSLQYFSCCNTLEKKKCFSEQRF